MALQYRLELDPKLSILIEEKDQRKRNLYLDTLKTLAKEEDREALQRLVGLKRRSTGSRSLDTLALNHIEIPPQLAVDIFKTLLKTGKLIYRSQAISFDPIPAKIYFKGEKHSEKACTVWAVVQSGSSEIPLENIEKIVPGWMFHQGRMCFLSDTIAWKWIEPMTKGPVLLEGVQKKQFLEEDPPVIWESIAEEKTIEVTPVLRLRDAHGCFAELWLCYGESGVVAISDLSPAVASATRQKDVESHWEKDLLETGYFRKDGNYFCPSDQVQTSLQFLLELGWHVEDYQRRTVLKQSRCHFAIRQNGETISIQGDIAFEKIQASLRKFAAASRFIELGQDRVGLVDPKSQQKINAPGEWVGDELVLKKKQIGSVIKYLKEEDIDWDPKLRLAAQAIQEGNGIEEALPAQEFQGNLLPYQQQGLNWLWFLYKFGFSGLLADEMGLGKTVQVLAFFSRIGTNLPVLIIAPASLLFHWKMEIARFLPGRDVYLHAGPDRLKELPHASIIVSSYSLLRIDAGLFRALEFEAVVFDESNAIKTANTLTARSAYALQGKFKLCLSGTPMENRFDEVLSQFRFLMPDLIESQANREVIRPFILRRKKEEVAKDLPEKIDQVVWVEMTERQKEIYQAQLENFRTGLIQKIEEEGIESHRMEVLEAILRLRQICSDPRLHDSDQEGAKISQLISDVEEAILEGRKVLIFSQFTQMLRLIREELNRRQWKSFQIDGSTPIPKRAEMVQKFQEDDDIQIFLLSLKAAGVGLNLTAADRVFLFDPWWNESVENQAIDRTHRIGQKKSVLARRYITPHSIEEKMMELKKEKQIAADQLLEDSSSWTAADFFRLLS